MKLSLLLVNVLLLFSLEMSKETHVGFVHFVRTQNFQKN